MLVGREQRGRQARGCLPSLGCSDACAGACAAVSKLFVDAYFPEASRNAALDMLHEIRDAFNASLRHKAWMDPVTRLKAVDKLGEMFMEVGHPTTWPPATFESFEKYGGVRETTYFENCVTTNSWDVQNTIAKMGKKVTREAPNPPPPKPCTPSPSPRCAGKRKAALGVL